MQSTLEEQAVEFYRDQKENLSLKEMMVAFARKVIKERAANYMMLKKGYTSPISVEDFHIGFEYEEYEMDSERYLNKGMIWVRKTYAFNSPRLHKIQKLIQKGKIRHVQQ